MLSGKRAAAMIDTLLMLLLLLLYFNCSNKISGLNDACHLGWMLNNHIHHRRCDSLHLFYFLCLKQCYSGI